MLLAHSAEGSADDVRFSFVRSFVVNTARAHYYRVPPRQEGHTLKGRSSGLGTEPEGSALGPVPDSIEGWASGQVGRRYAVLKYRVATPASSVSHPLPHPRACIGVVRPPLRDALPARPRSRLSPDVSGPDLLRARRVKQRTNAGEADAP